MSADPAFAAVVATAHGQVTTANTARDGSGTPVTIFTAGSSGSKINRVTIVATGTTTPGVVRLFLHDGTNARLFREILVQAVTPSTTVEVFRAELKFEDLDIPSGWSLRATTHNSETFNIECFAGSY